MSSKIEIIENNRAKLTLHIPAERFEEGMNYSYNKNKSKLKLPGFRAGKVPRSLAEKQFGYEVFLDDAINFCFQDAYSEAIDELDIDPVSRPELDEPEYNKETGIILPLIVWLKPEVKLGEYKGLSYEDKAAEVTDEEVDKLIDVEREKNSRLVSITDRPLRDGDTAIIDFEGFIDDEPFEGGEGTDYELVIGSNTFVDNFEEQLIGKNIGDEVSVSVTFPADYGKAEFQNKQALFKVRINEITVKELPEINDDFAQDISEFDTLDEYKNSIKDRLISQKESQKERDIETLLIDKASENAQCDIPTVMFENQIDQMVSEFANRLSEQGLTLNMFLQYSGKTMSEFRDGYRNTAEKDVKARLVLEAVANAENIEPQEDEINSEIARIAQAYGIEESKVSNAFRKEDYKGLKTDLKAQKALQLIKDNAVII